MIQGIEHMSHSEIVDLLATKTQQFTQMLYEKAFGERYDQVKKEVRFLVAEIERRRDISSRDMNKKSDTHFSNS
jgi:hypothetical protein